MELLQYTATLLGDGQWISLHALPHYWGAVGSGTPSAHYHTAREHWVVDLLKQGATLLGSSG